MQKKKISAFQKLALVVVGFALMEIVSALALLVMVKLYPEDVASKKSIGLLHSFPAQFRVKQEKLRDYTLSGIFEVGRLFTAFTFDPAMGYRDERYMAMEHGSPSDFLLCCLGGSTTAPKVDTPWTNWPVFLAEEAQKRNVVERLAVLNAGVPGYMSSNQHIYLTDWVMGKMGYQCDATLSLDGANDIQERIAAYTQTLMAGDDWIPAYHAYQQKMDHDIRYIYTPAGAAKHFAHNFATEALGKFFIRSFPYTTRLTLTVYKQASSEHENGAAEAQMGRLKKKGADFNKRGEFVLPTEVEDKIIQAYRNSLLDLAGSCNIRGIPFVSFLQPIHLTKYYDNPAPFSEPDPATRALQAVNWQAGVNVPIDVRAVYEKSERLYVELGKEHPENFKSLIYLFSDKTEKKLYGDTCHYVPEGSRYIAAAMIEELIRQGVLHVRQ